jgi:three-Cys-motif partner protein
MTRPRDIPDHADEKWVYSIHMEAKHEILHRYLGAWLAILGRGKKGFRHELLVLVDGFAGRGRYRDGEPGSPRIMFDRAVQAADASLAKKVLIRCAEPNPTNFAMLKEGCDDLKHDRVTIHPTKETFQELGSKLAAWAEKQKPPLPTFVMGRPLRHQRREARPSRSAARD